MTFKYEIGSEVQMTNSEEGGVIVGRAEYSNAANNYYVRYRSATGSQVEAWWTEDALRPRA